MEPHPSVPPIVPSVALLINLAPPVEVGENAEKAQVFAAQLGNLGLSATWIVEELRQARFLGNGQLAATAQEFALTASARSPQRLRSELTSRQAALKAELGHQVSVIVGDPRQLRARAALLADLGIRAVVANSLGTETTKSPRVLPCGLWQIDPAITLPQTGRRWSLLPTRQLTATRLLTMRTASQPIVVAIEPGRLSGRDLQNCQRLLQEIAEASRLQQLAVATVSEVVAQLARQHEVKPQRSILRSAA